MSEECVLYEAVASKRQGKPIYFSHMTRIGPSCTDNLENAHRFESRFVAMRSPAYLHLYSYFETMPVDEARQQQPKEAQQ